MTQRAIIYLKGQIDSPDYPVWITNHARKLGVQVDTQQTRANMITIKARGAPEMIQALALGCSLGPESVLVTDMEITDAP